MSDPWIIGVDCGNDSQTSHRGACAGTVPTSAAESVRCCPLQSLESVQPQRRQPAGATDSCLSVAEFRPSRSSQRWTAFGGFRDRPIQPLSHLSGGVCNSLRGNAQAAADRLLLPAWWGEVTSPRSLDCHAVSALEERVPPESSGPRPEPGNPRGSPGRAHTGLPICIICSLGEMAAGVPWSLGNVVARGSELASARKLRFTHKALRELAGLDLESDQDDCCGVLEQLTAIRSAGRIRSAVTGEWMYVFKPAVPSTRLYR